MITDLPSFLGKSPSSPREIGLTANTPFRTVGSGSRIGKWEEISLGDYEPFPLPLGMETGSNDQG